MPVEDMAADELPRMFPPPLSHWPLGSGGNGTEGCQLARSVISGGEGVLARRVIAQFVF
jgi:hypothetical protein